MTAPGRRAIVLLSVTVAACLAVFGLVPSSRSVEARGRSLIRWPFPDPIGGSHGFGIYQWLPDGQIVVESAEGPIYVIDPRTGRRRFVRSPSPTGLFQTLSPSGAYIYGESLAAVMPEVTSYTDSAAQQRLFQQWWWQVSPDGAYLLTTSSTVYNGDWYTIIRLRDRAVASVREDRNLAAISWHVPSDGWTSVTSTSSGTRAVEHSLSGLHFDPIAPIGSGFLRSPSPVGLAVSGPQAARPGHVLMLGSGQAYFDPITTNIPIVIDVCPAGTTNPAASVAVPLPAQGTLKEAALSPDGRTVAWLVTSPAQPSLWGRCKDWFQSWTRGRGPTTVSTPLWAPAVTSPLHYEVWEEGTDGRGRREVVEGDEAPVGGVDRPWYIRWTPDGKSISFVYKGSLWAVPAQ